MIYSTRRGQVITQHKGKWQLCGTRNEWRSLAMELPVLKQHTLTVFVTWRWKHKYSTSLNANWAGELKLLEYSEKKSMNWCKAQRIRKGATHERFFREVTAVHRCRWWRWRSRFKAAYIVSWVSFKISVAKRPKRLQPLCFTQNKVTSPSKRKTCAHRVVKCYYTSIRGGGRVGIASRSDISSG